MAEMVVFDCEFLAVEGSQRRFWCGGHDPDPVVAQIGAVRLSLAGDFQIDETFMRYVVPRGRDGSVVALDPFFTQLTGITQGQIDGEGVSLREALEALEAFSRGARMWSWGKDEFNMLAISCYVEGFAPPISVGRFDNAVKLMIAGGMPIEDLAKTPSSQLAAYYGVAVDGLRAHDGLGDAMSLALALQHLLRTGKLAVGAIG